MTDIVILLTVMWLCQWSYCSVTYWIYCSATVDVGQVRQFNSNELEVRFCCRIQETQ